MKSSRGVFYGEVGPVREWSESAVANSFPVDLDQDAALLRVLLDMVKSLKEERLRRHLTRDLREAIEAKGRYSREKSVRNCEKKVP